MNRTVSMASLILIVSVVASAQQQQRRVVRMGGQGEDPTRDWPKIEEKAADVTASLDSYLQALVDRRLFSGTVLVARDGKPLYFKSFGLANREWNIANTNDTKYSIGSINKIFTKMALLQLRDAGKIDFSKTLRTYLPDAPASAHDVTIQQLIDHRSGVGDIFGPEYDAMPKERLRSLRDYLPLFAGKPLEFEPGARQRYSNAGYILLGLLIEKVSGMSYYDYVRARIYEPAGMTDTDSYEMDAVVAKRATGYRRDGTSNIYTRPAKPSSAGGGYSTALDLLRFTRALPAILGQRTFDHEFGRTARAGWGGGAPGMNAMVELQGAYTVIVLANTDPPAAMAVARSVRAALGLPLD